MLRLILHLVMGIMPLFCAASELQVEQALEPPSTSQMQGFSLKALPEDRSVMCSVPVQITVHAVARKRESHRGFPSPTQGSFRLLIVLHPCLPCSCSPPCDWPLQSERVIGRCTRALHLFPVLLMLIEATGTDDEEGNMRALQPQPHGKVFVCLCFQGFPEFAFWIAL